MATAFKTQDQIFNILKSDTVLLNIIGNPVGNDALNIKFKREMCSVDVINAKDLDFISFYFVNAMPTKNYMVNKGILIIDYYTALRYNSMLLSDRVVFLLNKYMDLNISSEGQIPSGMVGIYQYRQRFMPTIWS